MSISLEKGQQISLSKLHPSLSQITIGLAWDPAKVSGGFLAKFIDLTPKIDCDTSVILLDKDETISDLSNLIYYGNPKDPSGSILLQGDNTSGSGDNDDEKILIDLHTIPENIHHILFLANIYESNIRMQDFGMIKNASIRILHTTTEQELLKYTLNESFPGKTTLLVARLYRSGSEWKFLALGEGTNEHSLKDFIRRYYVDTSSLSN